MTAPSNYDAAGVVFRVDPVEMFSLANVDIRASAEVIATAVGAIQTIWEGLALGWAGRSATEAQDFANRWNLAVTNLFGSESDPSSGVLPRVADAVGIAAMNFGIAEDSVYSMFATVTEGLDAPPGPAQPPVRDHTTGPVTETAPAPA